MKNIFSILIVFTAILCAGCGSGGAGRTISGQTRLTITMIMPVRGRSIDDVTKLRVQVKKGEQTVVNDSFPWTTQSGSSTISQNYFVPSGDVSVQVDALRANDVVEYTGSTTVTIGAGIQAAVNVTLQSPATAVGVNVSIHDINGPPKIEFTSVPPLGSFDNVKGKVSNVLPSSGLKIIAFIYVVGRWWVKPYNDTPFTTIKSDGTFEFDYTTGGVDDQATEIRAYLVTKDYIYNGNLPLDPPTDQVLAMVSSKRAP